MKYAEGVTARSDQVAIDKAVFAFVFGLTLLSSFVIGVVSALKLLLALA